VTSHVDWIEVDGQAATAGSGSVDFTVAPNQGCSDRSALLMAAGATVMVTQQGHPPASCPRRASGRRASS
jgi:hypothetical protein